MGLITEYVEIKVGNRLKYFESKGYEIPKTTNSAGRMVIDNSKPLKVKVTDLTSGSNQIVEVKCDECGLVQNMKYSVFNRYVHDDNKYYCHSCAPKVLSSGENNPRWNSEIDHDTLERNSSAEYREFNRKVRAKCHFKCFCCKTNLSSNGDVHHLNSYDWDIENRLNDNNAVLLCEKCHKAFHNVYGYGKNTIEQFLSWTNLSKIEYESDAVIISSDRKIIDLDNLEIYNSVYDCSKALNTKETGQIYKCLNHKDNTFTAIGHHLLWLDEYNKLSKGEIFAIKTKAKNQKVIVCITTGKIFFSLKKASDAYNININSLVKVYKKINKTAGKKEWLPLDEFLLTYSENKIKEILLLNKDNNIEEILQYRELLLGGNPV